jgi:hypothetical protein
MRHSTRRHPTRIEFNSFERDGLTVLFERGLDLDHAEILRPLGIVVEWPSMITSRSSTRYLALVGSDAERGEINPVHGMADLAAHAG